MQSCLVCAFQLLHSFPSTFPLSLPLHSTMHVCPARTHCSHCLLFLCTASKKKKKSRSSRRANRWRDGKQRVGRQRGKTTCAGPHSWPGRQMRKWRWKGDEKGEDMCPY